MTSNVMPSVVQIEGESLKQLVTEVKETLATNINLQPTTEKNKKFGIVDMWNCQRNVRTAV
jgi:hypothetical protein